ncbi:MAG: tetratricopeptide repeat protein [Amphritea sp.]|nr:tetratricopeptide repeat protein [Amphritea sp.]
MNTSDGLEFVNRGNELRFLAVSLSETDYEPALIVIRSPSGFGKSSLTDQLKSIGSLPGDTFCIVDPSIRGRAGSVSLYDGFFLQRVAESIDSLASSAQVNWPTLSDFLKERKRQSLATKKPSDIVSELPSLKHAYKTIYDYASRAFAFGRYAPEKLLVSDESDAIAICYAYVEHLLEAYSLTVVIREAQHIDLHSLRALLLWSESHPGPNLIIEYTTEDGNFESEHQKIILRSAANRNQIKILDLVQLSEDHLEYLLRSNVHKDFHLTSDYYLSWDGNLRSIIELKFQVGIGHSLVDGSKVGRTLTNLTDTIIEHVSTLSPLEKIIVAVVSAHIESINLSTVVAVIYRINPQESQSSISKAISSLEGDHSFLVRTARGISIRNDTVSNSLNQSVSMKGLIALSEKALKEHYADILNGSIGANGFFEAVRLYFRLCAQTKDVQGLVWSVERLSLDIKSTQDQSIYIDVIASAIEADPELYRVNHEELLTWSAELAYSASDWYRATNLLSLKSEKTPYLDLMYACALQEIGRHQEALDIVEGAGNPTQNTGISIAKCLIEVMIIGCQGRYDDARIILRNLVTKEEYSSSPLIGYAYRFFEIVDGLEPSIEALKKSVIWFEKHGLEKSKAYSQLALAMLLARSGELSQAQEMIDIAVISLSGEVIDQHIILNNTGAVELLKDRPDFSICCELFTSALKFACDDFSELTILVNLSLSYLGSGNLEEAERHAEKCLLILEDHDFVDTNIYWPVCFNASLVFSESGNMERSREVRKIPVDKFGFRTDDSAYWKYRFDVTSDIPESHRFLSTKDWHPVYLSHWLIDLEGLSLLKSISR